MRMNLLHKKKRGFTIIEGLTALLVFSFLVMVFYKVFTQTAVHMQDGKQRRAAVSLANERMEHYRNLAYANVGTTTNAPFGNIVADENVAVNEMVFRIITSVILVDDPWDGKAAGGVDLIPNDYKRVSVSVIWDQCVDSSFSRGTAEYGSECSVERVRLVSQFVPPGGLETIESGGILSINVLDEEAGVIPEAILTIYDSVRDETFAVQTDSTGNYMYIGAPACQNCYEITVEKSGYEKLSTKLSPAVINVPDAGGNVEYFPRFVHQSVANNTMTTMTLIMQKYADMTVTTEDPFGEEFPNIDFDIYGGRVMGTDLGTNSNYNAVYDDVNVYGLYAALVTDATNSVATVRTDTNDDNSVTSADHVNSGVFTFALDSAETDYVFWKMMPESNIAANKVKVETNSTVDAHMVLLSKNEKSMLFRITDPAGASVSGVIVQVYDDAEEPTYEAVQNADFYGMAFLPIRSTEEPHDVVPLLEEDTEYTYVITGSGYETFTDTVTVDEDKLYEIDVTLIPST